MDLASQYLYKYNTLCLAGWLYRLLHALYSLIQPDFHNAKLAFASSQFFSVNADDAITISGSVSEESVVSAQNLSLSCNVSCIQKENNRMTKSTAYTRLNHTSSLPKSTKKCHQHVSQNVE